MFLNLNKNIFFDQTASHLLIILVILPKHMLWMQLDFFFF